MTRICFILPSVLGLAFVSGEANAALINAAGIK
jgi:hypothetical protein